MRNFAAICPRKSPSAPNIPLAPKTPSAPVSTPPSPLPPLLPLPARRPTRNTSRHHTAYRKHHAIYRRLLRSRRILHTIVSKILRNNKILRQNRAARPQRGTPAGPRGPVGTPRAPGCRDMTELPDSPGRATATGPPRPGRRSQDQAGSATQGTGPPGISAVRMKRAGTPAQTSRAGTSLVTTAPIPTSASSPMTSSWPTRAPAPT